MEAFSIFPGILFVLFDLIFFAVFFFVLVKVVKTISQTRKQSPGFTGFQDPNAKVTVGATVLATRQVQPRQRKKDVDTYDPSKIRYFVTFRTDSGQTVELEANRYDFGMLVQGSHGEITFQSGKLLHFGACAGQAE